MSESLWDRHRRAKHSDSCWSCDKPWPCPTIAALIDADHDWALWHEKWCAAMDLVGNLGEDVATAEARLARIEAWIAEDENQWIQRGDVRYVLAGPARVEVAR